MVKQYQNQADLIINQNMETLEASNRVLPSSRSTTQVAQAVDTDLEREFWPSR